MGRGAETGYGAFRTVKASDAEHHEGQRIHAAACDAWRPDVAAAKWQAIAGNTSGLAIQGAFIAVLATGGARVASGALGVSILMACLLHVHYLMAPIEQWSVLPANTRWAPRRWQGLRRLNGGRWNPPPSLRAAAAPQRRSRSRRSLPQPARVARSPPQRQRRDPAPRDDGLHRPVGRGQDRLPTVTMADRIIVMDAGWVKAAGAHAELAARNPLHAELAATQLLASTETRWPDPGTGRQRRSWPGRR